MYNTVMNFVSLGLSFHWL